ncbi:ribbon-helix-helix protein, CopG family [Aurantiacibacter zhengii]|uniref:Ribbon-helix-helix protein, CopG family n=2 Tax=Aurantiacibacter zhengii TaxID=2307003 RepID=A0A418NPM9_9SPHN|nr:ribbon-helix-helix protein, CopG family [Aurantiacibacter zhengii]
MHNSERVCMERKFQSVGVTLSPQMVGKLDHLANVRGVSRSEAIRVSLELGVPLLNLGIALNGQRALTILEHTQLALSLLVERQYPEDSDELIRAAMRNVREHHA